MVKWVRFFQQLCLLALEATVMSDKRRSEVDREKFLSGCQSEGCVLVVISAEPDESISM